MFAFEFVHFYSHFRHIYNNHFHRFLLFHRANIDTMRLLNHLEKKNKNINFKKIVFNCD